MKNICNYYISGLFEKQTSRGWDHKVLVTLRLVDGHSVVLEWGNKGNKKMKNIVFDETETPKVSVKAMNGNCNSS